MKNFNTGNRSNAKPPKDHTKRNNRFLKRYSSTGETVEMSDEYAKIMEIFNNPVKVQVVDDRTGKGKTVISIQTSELKPFQSICGRIEMEKVSDRRNHNGDVDIYRSDDV